MGFIVQSKKPFSLAQKSGRTTGEGSTAMNLEALLSVASKVGTPLALAGIIVIVLYALYKQVLALKLFAPIEAGPTARLLENVLNKLFWLALLALILGVASYIVTALFPHSTSTSSSSEDRKTLEVTAGR